MATTSATTNATPVSQTGASEAAPEHPAASEMSAIPSDPSASAFISPARSSALTSAALETLVRENQAALLAYAYGLVRSEQAARDIVQDTFLRLFRQPPVAERAKFWLFHVCRNRAIDWWRSRHEYTLAGANAQDDSDASDFFENLPDETVPHPGTVMQEAEELDAVMRHVEALPARQRELVRLKFQAGLSYKEIAATTGLSVTNVGFILHTAIQNLRAALARQD